MDIIIAIYLGGMIGNTAGKNYWGRLTSQNLLKTAFLWPVDQYYLIIGRVDKTF